MKLTSKPSIFALSLLLGLSIALAAAAWSRYGQARQVPVYQMTAKVWVSAQLQPQDLAGLRERGFVTVIDLRPDEDMAAHPPSALIGVTAHGQGMQFAYVPLGRGEITEKAVRALERALKIAPGPVLVYCRSGRSAARTWSLVEASRHGGLSAAEIESAVRNSGQAVDDLDQEIKHRISLRDPSTLPAA